MMADEEAKSAATGPDGTADGAGPDDRKGRHKDGSRKERDGRGPRSADKAQADAGPAAMNRAHTEFHGPVYMGSGAGAGEQPGFRRRAVGKFGAAEISAALEGFVSPPGFDDALDALLQDRVVVLCGRAGTGREAGAIALLSAITEGSLIQMPTVVTVDELAGWDYEKGAGYLVVDRVRESGAAMNFNWRTVRERVAGECGAYLVVTTTQAPPREAATVRHVAWTPPLLDDVLRAHLPGVGEDDIGALVGAIPVDWTMATVARLARRVAAGEDRTAVLEEFDVASFAQVDSWFGDGRTRSEILDVTALAFAEGCNRRTFESLRTKLADCLEDWGTPARPAGQRRSAEVAPPASRQRLADLVEVRQLQVGHETRRALLFAVPEYRRHVLAQLTDRYGIDFWDGVQEWLEDVVGEEVDLAEVAHGLALFAAADVEEVRSSYLEPWAAAELGIVGQITAAYALWFMCLDEALSAVALQTAIGWTNDDRSLPRRWTACLALSGELGAQYPADAARRLWQLVTQGTELTSDGCQALANLFATIVLRATEDRGDAADAGAVLQLLATKLAKFGRVGVDVRQTQLAVQATLAVLSVHDGRTGTRPAMTYLIGDERRTQEMAGLWAGVVRHRPSRQKALMALWAGLDGLVRSSPDPDRDATAFGEALARVLPADEESAFERDFTALAARTRSRHPVPLAEVLLAALERIKSQQPGPVLTPQSGGTS